MPNPKRKILFHYYLESDRGLDCYFYLACVVPCHAAEEVCFPLECCKHCLKVYRLLVVIMSNVPNSLFYSHTQYQPVSQISCLDRFYILLPWQGQKGGGFSSPLCGVQRDPQAQMGILPCKMLCHRDTGNWSLRAYAYKRPNLSFSLFFSLASLQCCFLGFIIIFAFQSLTTSLMLIIGCQSDLQLLQAGDKQSRCFVDPYNPDINSTVVCDSGQMIPHF